MDQHVKIVGILHIVMNGLSLIFIGALFLLFGGVTGAIASMAHGDPHAAQFLAVIGVFISFILGIVGLLAVPGLIAGFAVMSYQNWARWVLIIISGLHLLNFPIGTIIGAYTLWALLTPETGQLFERGGVPTSTTPENLQL